MAEVMGEDLAGLSEQGKAFAFNKALDRLIESIGPKDEKLSDYGISHEQMDIITLNAFDTMGALFKITPVKMSTDDVVSNYKDAY